MVKEPVMMMMDRTLVAALAAALVYVAAVTLQAHDVIYKGTVLAVSGETIRVQVIDEKTKKESPMTFEITPQTKVYRGDTATSFADARVQKSERIVVTVNHDVSPTKATIVRLAPLAAYWDRNTRAGLISAPRIAGMIVATRAIAATTTAAVARITGSSARTS
jgi:hypothetical protein